MEEVLSLCKEDLIRMKGDRSQHEIYPGNGGNLHRGFDSISIGTVNLEKPHSFKCIPLCLSTHWRSLWSENMSLRVMFEE